MQRALRYLAAASGALVAGNLFTLDAVVRQGAVHAGSLADVCFLASYPLALAAYLSIPVGHVPRGPVEARSATWGWCCPARACALWFFVLRAHRREQRDRRRGRVRDALSPR